MPGDFTYVVIFTLISGIIITSLKVARVIFRENMEGKLGNA